MIYQINKQNDKYQIQIGGTVRQIERLSDYFNVDVPFQGIQYMYLYDFASRSDAQKVIDEIPEKLAKVKTDISYVYQVNYYGSIDKEVFSDCRKDVAEEYLKNEIEEITELVNNTEEHKFPIEPKLTVNRIWGTDDDYQDKTWQIGSKQVEFSKSPNAYFTFVKKRHRYNNMFR